MVTLERQEVFGWPVAADLFFGGAGAGVFLDSFMLDILGRGSVLTRIGTVLGPALVLLGILFLIVELHSKGRFYKVFSNPASWMTRGSWGLVFFIAFSLAYSLPLYVSWLPAIGGKAVGIVAAVFSIFVPIYTGLLLGVVKRVPFWNTSLLPLIFLFSGLSNGIAILFLVAPFLGVGGQETIATLRYLIPGQISLILMQLIAIGLYIEIASHGSVSARESVRLLKGPLFIGGVLVTGLVVPLVLLFYGAGLSSSSALLWLTGVTGTLLLAGGISLRYVIIRTGVYLPLYTP